MNKKKKEVKHPDEFDKGLNMSIKKLTAASVSASKGDVRRVLMECVQHNLRQGNEHHKHRHSINTEKSTENSVLLGGSTPQIVVEITQSIFDELGLSFKRKDAVAGIEIVFQAPEGWDNGAFWGACLGWVKSRYQHVVSAVVHRDQKRPHMHVIALPILDGSLKGSDMTSGANHYASQQSSFYSLMRTDLGLRKDRPSKKPKTLMDLALSCGKGAKTHAQAERRDAEFKRQTDESFRKMGQGFDGLRVRCNESAQKVANPYPRQKSGTLKLGSISDRFYLTFNHPQTSTLHNLTIAA